MALRMGGFRIVRTECSRPAGGTHLAHRRRDARYAVPSFLSVFSDHLNVYFSCLLAYFTHLLKNLIPKSIITCIRPYPPQYRPVPIKMHDIAELIVRREVTREDKQNSCDCDVMGIEHVEKWEENWGNGGKRKEEEKKQREKKKKIYVTSVRSLRKDRRWYG